MLAQPFLLAVFAAIVLTTEPIPLQVSKHDPSPVNKTRLLELVNAARAKGCQCGTVYFPAALPLVWNGQLEQAASEHSDDMLSNRYFAHAAADGSKGGDRIQRAGYQWRTYGENIAFGYHNEKEVVDGWLKSPGHCKNIMNRAYKEMGISRAGDYWTQVLAAK